MKPCVIFDMDGTLANCEHRRHLLPNWDAFFDAMVDDTANEGVLDLAHMVQTQVKILVVSARPSNYLTHTATWLMRHGVHPAAIYMRLEGDFRKDSIVKAEILEQIKAEGWNPLFVVDDRKSVVDMWREKGLTCLQCAPGDFDVEDVPDYENTSGAEECLLTLMVGPSGAGKTTLAHEMFPAHTIISSDQTRAEICGDFKDQSQNKRVHQAMREQAKARLRHGQPVVIDATNIKRKDRMRFVDMAPKGTVVRYVLVDRPLEDKLKTAGWRHEVVFADGDCLVTRCHKQFQNALKLLLSGDRCENVFIEDRRNV